jgi:hypothetical protein
MYLPRYQITETLLGLTGEAEALRTRILTSRVDVPWLEQIRFDTLARRAHFSTAIEGNPLTLPEVEALARGRRAAVKDRARREVVNYLATLRWLARQSPRLNISEARAGASQDWAHSGV